MVRRYYSSRQRSGALTIDELYWKFRNLYLFFRKKDYFREVGITTTETPDEVQHEAAIELSFQPFPMTKWPISQITEDHIFDAIEFLYDRVSRPGKWTQMVDETNYAYFDYESYDKNAGQDDFRERTNLFLADYKSGFELGKEGKILALGTHGVQHILEAEIVPYDEVNVDRKVRDAINKWRNRHLSVNEKKEAIRELADVFEWLKKSKSLDAVLDRKDDSAIFELANKFAIRHHNPAQKANYDINIWYSWMFHFYLATYHAVIRLLLKHEQATDARRTTS